jgi:anti-sigma factor RsiW
MNCQACQEKILLFDVISAQEEHAMQQHMGTCASCQQAWADMMTYKSKLAEARKHTPPAPDNLTDRIMTAVIRHQAKQNHSDQMSSWFTQPKFRFAFAGLSVCLTVFFLSEWLMPTSTLIQLNPTTEVQNVLLEGQAFFKKNQKKEKRRSVFSPCLTAKEKQAAAACLKEKIKAIQF